LFMSSDEMCNTTHVKEKILIVGKQAAFKLSDYFEELTISKSTRKHGEKPENREGLTNLWKKLWRHATLNELETILKKLKTIKSPGQDLDA